MMKILANFRASTKAACLGVVTTIKWRMFCKNHSILDFTHVETGIHVDSTDELRMSLFMHFCQFRKKVIPASTKSDSTNLP